jgi:hypothetical protein
MLTDMAKNGRGTCLMPIPGLPDDAAPPADEELWRLKKGTRTAVCWRRLHPLGVELRLDVNGDTMRTTVEKTSEAARQQSAHMHTAMVAQGWQAAPGPDRGQP